MVARIPRKKGQPANSKKHSDLYTDENPKGTIKGLGFKDRASAVASVAKIKRSDRHMLIRLRQLLLWSKELKLLVKHNQLLCIENLLRSKREKLKTKSNG